jgi:hypothetical protein
MWKTKVFQHMARLVKKFPKIHAYLEALTVCITHGDKIDEREKHCILWLLASWFDFIDLVWCIIIIENGLVHFRVIRYNLSTCKDKWSKMIEMNKIK